MNAIALLSGWGHQRDVRNPASSRRASLSRHDGDAGRRQQEGLDEGSPLQQEDYANHTSPLEGQLGHSAIEERLFGIDGSLRSTASTAEPPQLDDLTRIVKPPEAAAYEELEDAAAQLQPSGSSVDPASIYPTPPASRNPTPTDAIDEAARRENGNGHQVDVRDSVASTSHTPSRQSIPASRFQGKLFRRQASAEPSRDDAAPATPQQQRRLSDRQTRALARSLPVRCIARIYVLLRRFFALFGIRLEPVPTLANAPEVPSLTCPVLAIPPTAQAEEAPPSYQDATKSVTTIPSVQQAKAVQKDSKWRIGSLLNRSKSGHHLSDKEAASRSTEGYASTSSDEWTASEEKILLRKNGISPSGTSPSVLDTSSRGHTTTPSIKASVAQLALSKPKLLVLDLDETLIHSTSRMNYASGAVTSSVDGRSTWNANTSGLKVRVVEVVLDGRSVIYHVYKRPWVDFFLRKVSSWYTVVIFTASLQEYADPVIDWLDQGSGMISSRLFRESCTYVNGSYLKDLSIVDKDLARVCLVDNSPVSYAINPANGIPIEGWINDPNDEALLDLLPMLDSLRFTNDVRHVLALRLATTSTAMSAAAAKARRRRTSTLMSGDAAEQAAVQRAIQAHPKAE